MVAMTASLHHARGATALLAVTAVVLATHTSSSSYPLAPPAVDDRLLKLALTATAATGVFSDISITKDMQTGWAVGQSRGQAMLVQIRNNSMGLTDIFGEAVYETALTGVVTLSTTNAWAVGYEQPSPGPPRRVCCVDVAAELVSSYGELVSIKVGAKPYPAGSGRPRRVPPLPSTEGEIGGFKLRVEMGTTRLRAGNTTAGSVVVTSANTSLVEVFATANPGWLRVQATQEIAGGYSGAVAGAPRFRCQAADASSAQPREPLEPLE